MNKLIVIMCLVSVVGCYHQHAEQTICISPPQKETGKWVFNKHAQAYFWQESSDE